ncbi:P-II family nitrogen regulator [Natranaerobius thermophilus]|uniref:Nitrogen regulatory protein P-II n=1 Tax=Natranaerobius thermophilus (strain ATCC BAA-1301 / DSM 18059 / JW/NM-WN-LF) TaxID=457570 RepID=B2A1H9_NATTJ|nr:hypothetical protein [Natranaerobius thermophilus]ACB84719.1 conserved hypothetical protein [Natranaerobius thermophilus JW/NM-WN-LF]
MKLLVVTISDRTKLTPILDKFYERGIKGATVIDSHGMGHLIADHFPFFSRFAEIGDPQSDLNYTIFSVIKDEGLVDRAIKTIEEEVGDLEEENSGLAFVLPIDYVKGFPKQD